MTKVKIQPIIELARCESLLRDQGTILGFGWTLLNPIVNWLVLFTMFAPWASAIQSEYSLYLLVGLVYWNFFSQATGALLTAFDRRRFLALNIAIPPFSFLLSAFVAIFKPFLVENAVLIALLAVLGRLSIEALWAVPTAVGLTAGLALIAGILLSVLNSFLRDAGHLWALLLRMGFFVTPVFLPREFISQRAGGYLLTLNPLVGCLDSARIMIATSTPTSLSSLPCTLLSICVLTILTPPLFKKFQSRLIEAI
ncbi:MAG: ABC transporter permease [Deltaproteobacteria bacterium]|nr:ABC transporter permease [Deltaproteobacteria bacterium]